MRSDQANHTDVELNFSIKFRQGIAADLWPHILAACYALEADTQLARSDADFQFSSSGAAIFSEKNRVVEIP